jgi:hypothetical protein
METEIALPYNRVLRIIQDENPESPREWDNLGTMICSHRKYKLGDKQLESKLDQMQEIVQDLNIREYIEGLDEDYWYDEDKLQEFIETKEGAVVLPLYIYDHSGITMNTTGFSCRWDSGQVGWIYVSKERIIEEYGDASKESVEKARRVLESEVETYAQYLEGDVYGFEIVKQEQCDHGHVHEKHEDSCWGFYGHDINKNGMLDYINEADCKIILGQF